MEVDERLRLPPAPASAGEARAFVTTALAQMGLPALADSARLAISEVVTNVILHAGTDMEVTVRRTDRGVRVEVWDASPVLPALRHYGGDATTGRGLGMVTALVAELGVEPTPPHGKRVWFTLDAADPAASRAAGPADGLGTIDDLLTDDWDLDRLLADLAPGEADAWEVTNGHRADAGNGADAHPPAAPATLVGLPVRLWRATQRHHDAVLRELGFHRRAHRTPDQILDADVHMARQAHALLADAVNAAALLAHPEPAAVPDSLDVPLRPPPGVPALADMYATLQDLLDEAEELAGQGLLLVRPALPEMVALRDWCCEQVIAQVRGVAAAPWMFPPDEPEQPPGAVRTDASPSVAGWDDTQVRESSRCVVAADDRNRLVAVSAPAAALLGWQADELVGRRIVTMIPHRLREAHVAGFAAHLATGQVTMLGTPTVLPVLRADGSELRCTVLIEEASVMPEEAGGLPVRVYVAWLDPLP